jgi:hypothetical protein
MATKSKTVETPEGFVDTTKTAPIPDPVVETTAVPQPAQVVDPSVSLTPGQRACGVSFNPGGDPRVDRIKREFATCVDTLLNLRDSLHDGEVQRMLSIAITEAQTAQMWAVKAVTWRG